VLNLALFQVDDGILLVRDLLLEFGDLVDDLVQLFLGFEQLSANLPRADLGV
jgi:hypothetical protein